MKKGISLIVLVITIIVMIILAASVVLTLSNTGIIERADLAVQATNKNQLQTSIDLFLGDLLFENNGKMPNSFELVEGLYTNNIITEAQKAEMLANGGELKFGESFVRVDTSSIITSKWIETVQTDVDTDTWKLRFDSFLNKTDGVEYTEFGSLLAVKSNLDGYKPDVDMIDKFNIENKTAGAPISVNSAAKYTEHDDGYEWVMAITGITGSNKDTVICVRGYAKYVYNGVEGIIYSNTWTLRSVPRP